MSLKISICLLVFAAAGLAVYFYKVIKQKISGKTADYSVGIKLLVSKSITDIKGSDIIRLEIAAAVITLAFVFLTSQFIIIVLAVPAMLSLPEVYIKFKRQKYIKEYYSGLTGFLESISSNLKAGLSIVRAFGSFAGRDTGPVGVEMSMVLKKVELGKSLQEALRELADKIPLKENEIIISALNTALETGGNITEVLESILETIRKRDELRREVISLTSQGVLSGVIVGLLPVFLIIVVSLIDPQFMEPMLATTTGKMMLGAAVLMEITGALVIGRIINVR
jgi:tight adherence protein B